MRLKQCRLCGAAFEGTEYQQVCPTCLAAQRATTRRPRTCQTCGVTFSGGPSARYCPDCRAARAKERAAHYRKFGPARQLGSTDTCVLCGKEYIVNGGLQRYCPDCAPDIYRELDRAASIKWNREHKDRMQELKRSNIRLCVVCGKQIKQGQGHQGSTCSPECKLEQKRRVQRRADQKRRAKRKEAKNKE